MSTDKQLALSKTRIGRIKLHLLTFLRDKHFNCHLAGIKRELKELSLQ